VYLVRSYSEKDKEKLLNLYKQVAKNIGGIARTSNEITEGYINKIIERAAKNGVHFVVEHPTDKSKLIGEIHCYKLEPSVFKHILSELTMVVLNNFQGEGIGKSLLIKLLNTIETERTDILRVELIARESNKKALQFYEKSGFKIEGKLENRIAIRNGKFEADIPMAWMNKNYKLTE